ncbi:MAG: chorismate mutase, partial [Deltaproteobacteria bacterium]|nr:chorismate mutase [Deltaproteobacteria bacterium]
MPKNELERLRRQIDALDAQFLKLLNRRAGIVLKVGKAKRTSSEEFYTPHREKLLMERLKKRNKGPFPTRAIPSVFSEIISASRSLHAPMKVAYLGPEATFTHMAALRHFGRSCEMIPITSISRVFEEVENKRAECGVVPIENSTEGVVGATLDRFQDSSLKIGAEIVLPITHHFLTASGGTRGIQRIYSHPQAVAQCRPWLEDKFSNTPIVEVESTARAAARAAEDSRSGAIASEEAAHVYRLKIAERHIE